MKHITHIGILKSLPFRGGWRGMASPLGEGWRGLRGCWLGLCLLLSLTARADNMPVLEWQGRDTLHVRFQLTAGTVSLKPDYRVVAMPGIVSAADTCLLPLDTVEFAGRRNRKYNDRLAVLDHLPRRAVIYTSQDTLLVDTLIAVQPWMRDTTLSLCIARVMDGCCSIDTLDAECLAQTRYVVPVVQPVLPNNVAEQLVQEGEPLLEPISEYRPFDLETLYPNGVAYVRFPQDEWSIDLSFADNRHALERLEKILQRMEGDSASRIVRVVIVGTASPDGPVQRNLRLGEQRANVLKDYIAQRYDTTGMVLETVNAGEGWGNLTALLRNASDEQLPERAAMLRIIEETPDADRREHLLRTYREGRPFQRLLGMFDVQRTSAAVRLYYEAVSDTAAHIINEALRFIQYGSYQAAADLLEPLDDDRRYNVLGTAYYMLGRHDEAIECFERGATLGGEDARENLRQLMESNEKLAAPSTPPEGEL